MSIRTPTPEPQIIIPSPPILAASNKPIYMNIDGTNPKIDVIHPNGASDDELSYFQSYFRFGPSITTDTPRGSIYVAQLSDIERERKFHNILGKEYIDGEVFYVVDWIPELVRGSILIEAQAQPLINRFEARCQAQCTKQSNPIISIPGNPTISRGTSETSMRGRCGKQRGRPRKLTSQAQQIKQNGSFLNPLDNTETAREVTEEAMRDRLVPASSEQPPPAPRGALKQKRRGRPRKPASKRFS